MSVHFEYVHMYVCSSVMFMWMCVCGCACVYSYVCVCLKCRHMCVIIMKVCFLHCQSEVDAPIVPLIPLRNFITKKHNKVLHNKTSMAVLIKVH